jgi:TonB-dependent receptor
MNIFATKGGRAQRTSLFFKLSPVAAACTMLVTAMSAQAQTSATPTADAPIASVTVTGIRRGIEDAISVKKDSTSIVEAISAEDIGKLPDVSIAESIARLPGLAAQRVAGRAQVISVRGLSPDFSTTLLNGREQVSTGDNRSVEFDQYPSELLSGVTIYKTPDASLVGQGLSGTIDMQTVRPLSFGGRTVALNARGEHNSLGKIANASANGERFSASYIDQFANRTIGIALGYAHLTSPILDNQTGLYEPWKTATAQGGDTYRNGVPAGTAITDGIKSLATSGKNERDGFMGVLQYRPNQQWNNVLDVYASRFKAEQTGNQFETNLGDYNGGYQPGLQYNPITTSNGILTGATANNVYPLVRGMYNKRKDDIRAVGWNTTYKNGGMTLTGDLSYSKATRDELSLENNTQYTNFAGDPFLDNLKLSFQAGQFAQLTGTRNYSDPANLYVRNTIYGSGYGKVPHVDDELKSFRLGGNFAIDRFGIASVDVGVNYSDRTKVKRQPEGNINLKGNPSTISPDLEYGLVDLGFAGSGMIPSWNVPGVVAKYMTFNPTDTESYLISKAWQVKEKITTTYVKGNIDTDVNENVTLRGNFGLQVQRTDQSSHANYFDGTKPVGQQIKPTDDGKTYTDVLPSMNLAFGFQNDQTVRLAAARQIARARVDQLRSALDFGVGTVDFKPGASGGNAELDPWRANAYDISYEKYFGKKAYVALAGFHKKLVSYIYTQTQTYDFSKYTPGTPAITNFGNYTAPYNGKGGTLKGLELSGSMPFNLVSPVLDGFGIQASYTYSDSDIKIQDPDSNIGSNIPLPGLSKNVSNLTLYYEKNGFETRVSQRRRSDFVGEIGNFNGARTLRYVVGENVVDFQIGYTFQTGALKGVGLIAQVNNLTNQAYETYNGDRAKQLEYQKYGRTVLVGANYKF